MSVKYSIDSLARTMTLYVMLPTIIYPRRRPIGPPFFNDPAVPRNRPVPITPPILVSVGHLSRIQSQLILGYRPDHCNVTVFELALEFDLLGAAELVEVIRLNVCIVWLFVHFLRSSIGSCVMGSLSLLCKFRHGCRKEKGCLHHQEAPPYVPAGNILPLRSMRLASPTPGLS